MVTGDSSARLFGQANQVARRGAGGRVSRELWLRRSRQLDEFDPLGELPECRLEDRGHVDAATATEEVVTVVIDGFLTGGGAAIAADAGAVRTGRCRGRQLVDDPGAPPAAPVIRGNRRDVVSHREHLYTAVLRV